MRISYTNHIDSATAPTCLTTDLLYPASNMQNQRLSKRWRSTSATGQTIIIDLGSPKAVNTIALFGHGFTTSATLSINGNAANSWTAPSVVTSLTALTGPILKYLAASVTYRYWRFNLSDTSAANAYIELGRPWLGEYLTIDPASLDTFTVSKRRSDTVTYGRDRQKYATQGVGWRSFSLSFPKTGGAMLNAIQTMYDTVGNFNSVIFSNFDSSRSYPIVEPVYASIVGDIDFAHTRAQKYTYSLTLEEDR